MVPNLDIGAFCFLCAHGKSCQSNVAFFHQEETCFDLSRRKLCRAFVSVSLFLFLSHASCILSCVFTFCFYGYQFLHRKHILQWSSQRVGDVTQIHAPSSSLRCPKSFVLEHTMGQETSFTVRASCTPLRYASRMGIKKVRTYRISYIVHSSVCISARRNLEAIAVAYRQTPWGSAING